MNLEKFKNCRKPFFILPMVLMAISAISNVPLGHAMPGDTVSTCPSSLSIKRGASITCVLALPLGFDCAGGVTITPVGKFSPKLAATCLFPGPSQFAFNLTITARHSPKGDGTYTITASEQGILGATMTLTVTKT